MTLNCKFCGKACKNNNSKIQHELRCNMNPNKLNIDYSKYSHKAWNKGLTKETDLRIAKQSKNSKKYYTKHAGSFLGKHHSEETKEKISVARKSYLQENPDKVPFKLNHSSKESFPEKYFRLWLTKENLLDKQELNVDRYYLDFAWPNKKIYLEIDGSQHNLDYMKEHDLERTTVLDNLGWTCITRVDWSWYKSLSNIEKTNYLLAIKKAIINTKIVEKFVSNKELKQLAKDQKFQECSKAGKINKLGIADNLMLSIDEWQHRKELIINSGVDLTKYGWKSKVQKETGLTRRQVDDVIEHFNDYFKNKIYIRP